MTLRPPVDTTGLRLRRTPPGRKCRSQEVGHTECCVARLSHTTTSTPVAQCQRTVFSVGDMVLEDVDQPRRSARSPKPRIFCRNTQHQGRSRCFRMHAHQRCSVQDRRRGSARFFAGVFRVECIACRTQSLSASSRSGFRQMRGSGRSVAHMVSPPTDASVMACRIQFPHKASM